MVGSCAVQRSEGGPCSNLASLTAPCCISHQTLSTSPLAPPLACRSAWAPAWRVPGPRGGAGRRRARGLACPGVCAAGRRERWWELCGGPWGLEAWPVELSPAVDGCWGTLRQAGSQSLPCHPHLLTPPFLCPQPTTPPVPPPPWNRSCTMCWRSVSRTRSHSVLCVATATRVRHGLDACLCQGWAGRWR